MLAWVVPGPIRQLTGGYLYDSRIVDGLRAREWRVGVVDVRSRRWPLDLSAGQRLVAAIGRSRWSAVVVDELAHPALVAALLGGRLHRALSGAPLILLVHHLRCSEPNGRMSGAVAAVIERLALRSVDLVICTSATTALTVRPFVRSDVGVEVVRPGWDTHPWPDPLPNPSSLLQWPLRGANIPRLAGSLGTCADIPTSPRPCEGEGQGEGVVRLLLVGHWTPRKGILDALSAVARLRPGVTLDLVGEQDRDRAYAARVRAMLNDPALTGRVRVHGRVTAEELVGLYWAADALVLPSTHEGYGMVLAEALAAGLPIVSTRVGAVPEVVRDGCEAELVPPGDVAALARAIDRLASDPRERRRRAQHARERAQELPRWSDSVEAFERHLKSLHTRRHSGA